MDILRGGINWYLEDHLVLRTFICCGVGCDDPCGSFVDKGDAEVMLSAVTLVSIIHADIIIRYRPLDDDDFMLCGCDMCFS
jgi:hypothetical protein